MKLIYVKLKNGHNESTVGMSNHGTQAETTRVTALFYEDSLFDLVI